MADWDRVKDSCGSVELESKTAKIKPFTYENIAYIYC